MKINYTHPSVRLTGRWDTTNPNMAVTVNTGSYIEFAFEGDMALALFDTYDNAVPALHLWISVDGGAMIEAPVDNYLRIVAPEYGKHTVKIIYKGGMEVSSRWYAPLHGKVSFIGYDAEAPSELAEDTRPTIEFVGDSITEGILTDGDFLQLGLFSYDMYQQNCVYQDDACATYAWRTATALDLRPIIMGFGAVGLTRTGNGRVPAAYLAYPYNFDGSPITHKPSDIVVINHGANDRGSTAENYIEKYALALDEIRKYNPNAEVVVLSAFCGAFHAELADFVAEYNQKNGSNVHYIDTFGWIPAEPLHPLRDGHRRVSENLVPLLREIIKNKFDK